MIIALMGETFEELTLKRPTLSLLNKLSIMGTSASMIKTKVDDEQIESCFLYVIQPKTDNEDGDEN